VYGNDLAYIHHHGFSEFAREAAPGILALLHGAGIDRGLVVDLGCGSGILAAQLVAAGYDVLGVDLSPDMLALARASAPEATFVASSLHEVDIPPCAAITAIGEPLTYATDGARDVVLRALFGRCAAALPKGGLLLFDVIVHVHGQAMAYRNWAAEGDDWMVLVDVSERGMTITRSIWTFRSDGDETYRRGHEVHRAWTFTRAELETWLREAGFVPRVMKGYGAAPLLERRMAFAARKR
jgi:SAM-dependent methyltransferase